MIKLITLLVAGIPAIITGILAVIGRKWAVFSATSLLMVALTVAFVAVINALVTALVSSAAIPGWAQPMGYVIPSDFGACLAALCSARIARAAYELAMDKARMFNTAQ